MHRVPSSSKLTEERNAINAQGAVLIKAYGGEECH